MGIKRLLFSSTGMSWSDFANMDDLIIIYINKNIWYIKRLSDNAFLQKLIVEKKGLTTTKMIKKSILGQPPSA